MTGKIVKIIIIIFVVGIVGNIARGVFFNLSNDSDDIAQILVDGMTKTKYELGDSFEGYIVQKDPHGAGVLITYTYKEGYSFDFDSVSDDVLRERSIKIFGKRNLKPFIDKGVYLILNFQSSKGEKLKKIVISPSNFA